MEEPRLTIEIDPELKRAFKAKVILEGKDMKEKVEEMISDYLSSK